jgi:hypothetical protein
LDVVGSTRSALKVKPTMFPPTAEEIKTMNLHRWYCAMQFLLVVIPCSFSFLLMLMIGNSMRILPHKADTGGFFIALLAKVRAPRPLTEEEHKALRGSLLCLLYIKSYLLHHLHVRICLIHTEKKEPTTSSSDAPAAPTDATTPTPAPQSQTCGVKRTIITLTPKPKKEAKQPGGGKEKATDDPFSPIDPEILQEIRLAHLLQLLRPSLVALPLLTMR